MRTLWATDQIYRFRYRLKSKRDWRMIELSDFWLATSCTRFVRHGAGLYMNQSMSINSASMRERWFSAAGKQPTIIRGSISNARYHLWAVLYQSQMARSSVLRGSDERVNMLASSAYMVCSERKLYQLHKVFMPEDTECLSSENDIWNFNSPPFITVNLLGAVDRSKFWANTRRVNYARMWPLRDKGFAISERSTLRDKKFIT